jgi:site-specific recombinase XerD
MKMETLMESYLESLRVRNFASGTIKTRSLSMRIFFEHLKTVGVNDVRAVNRDTMQDYQREIMRRYDTSTVRNYMAGVRQFFAQLENIGAILLNPTLDVRLPKWERRLPKRILKPSEVRRLLNAPDETPKGLRDRAMMELFYSSGIRREEMARLAVQDVDIKNGFVRVRGKGGKDRVVPIGQRACEALARYLKEARAVWLKAERNPGWTDALWLSPIQPHPPIHREAVGLILMRYAKRILGRNVSPHVWRHSYATHLVANGANILYVQRLLGHKMLKTTEIYTHVTMSELKRTLQHTHPRARRTSTPPVLTREEAAQMTGGHDRWQR